MALLCDLPPDSKLVWLDQAYFLNLFTRILDEGWLTPIQQVGPGYEWLCAAAKMGERMSLAATRTEAGCYIISSFGANFAGGTVQFARATPAAGAFTILAGTVIITADGGRKYSTTATAVFGATDLGPITVPVVATEADWEHDVPGQLVALDGQVLPGAINRIVTPIMQPPYADPTVFVYNVDEICGGSPPMLDQLGQDRGISRARGESDTAYQARIRRLPDTVSPGAIKRTIAAIFAPLHVSPVYIETWQIDYQTCWDAPSTSAGTPTYQPIPPTNPLYNQQLFVYDDPRPAFPPFANRWLSDIDYRGAFLVVVPNLAAMSDVGMAYDDTAVTPADLQDSIGYRSVSAYDVPSGFTAASQGGYDGFDLTKQSVYKGLYASLLQIKAAGVYFTIELEGE